MKKLFLSFLVVLVACVSVKAQKMMSAPTIMVVPDMVYCKSHGFVQEFDNNGVKETVPDYERALSEDPSLHTVLVLVSQLITDRNSDIVIKDILEAINSAKADAAMSAANGGDTSESVEEAIIRNSGADVLVKVQFDMAKHGPQYQVVYEITGTDAYTNQTFAPISGIGKPSTSANPLVLLREAVYENMDGFLQKVLTHYQSMLKKGRQVAFDIKVTSTSSVTMNSKVGDISLRELIDDFMYDNSVDGKDVDKVHGGRTFMQYESVYIPLVTTVRGRQRRFKTADLAQKLQNLLEEKNIQSDFNITGLGKVNFYIK